MTFDGLKGQTHLHIVHDVNVVEPEAYALQQRAFPALVAGDDPVVDQFDLLGGEPGADCFYNVLVISLAVESAVDGVIINTRPERCVVVIDNCEVLGFVVFENYYPVMGEDFTVIGY